jgi:hypothetical protein
MNSNEVKNYRGLVIMGIRELKDFEITSYCTNGSKPMTPPILPVFNMTEVFNISLNSTNKSSSLASDFYFLAFSSGCYYMDVSTGKWSSDGVEVQNDTSILYTHCKTSHLTTFAGGWVVLPTAIDFNYVFANASFEKNKTIYLTVIVLLAIFVLLAIWGRYMDKQDLLKSGSAPLLDNQPGHDYFYEITFITGSRKDSGTDSKVRLIVSGELDDTDVRIIEDPKRKIFRRSGIDSFILANKK